MSMKDAIYQLYENRVSRSLERSRLPRHVGVILDGNRRWARMIGESAAHGHRAGADKISEFLTWCDEAGIELVTLWLLSTENMSRDESEIKELVDIIVSTVERLAHVGHWRLHHVGDLKVLDEENRERLLKAIDFTKDSDGPLVNVAVGYSGRSEITEAVRALILQKAGEGMTPQEIADTVCDEEIEAHLYTRGQPDPDLVIRTSGEQRLSGFMPWQTVHSEYYFCEAYWPDFRRTDFLRALRSYEMRDRRHGR
ncbi:isoprenyl transferase [Flaviflexus salsibiostraticola]|uniref:Isoprenyl transferase n=1 Tax=Flaviflexus salsibiostraticola TaxID=1282737 RepID=A0A3Q8WV91_9ACTO|nr:isoprenyl transferase [Flaviflexus salsibiostraticola]AZN30711.1 isoprenyl transferase [Flaviflexus salsibiostraticola]